MSILWEMEYLLLSFFRGISILLCKGLVIPTRITILVNRPLPNKNNDYFIEIVMQLQDSIQQTKWAGPKGLVILENNYSWE
jgi:hypothetical protein